MLTPIKLTINPRDVLLLFALRNLPKADPRAWGIKTSVRELSQTLGLSEDQVQRGLKSLKGSGLIKTKVHRVKRVSWLLVRIAESRP